MKKEYVFYDQIGLDFPLAETIEVVTSAEEGGYLISNSEAIDAVLYAPEIDFYLKRSNDSKTPAKSFTIS